MNKLLFLIPLLLNFSCQENKKKKADKHQFSYTIDTVTVDPGEEILYLKGNLRWSALSSDNKYLFNSQLTENSKTGKYKNEVQSEEEFRKEITRMGQEINFMAPVWDEQNEKFYRFSYKEKPGDNTSEEMVQAKADVFITVLDENLKVLRESKVDILDRRPAQHFVKDGRIWIYENIDDELGFVRLSLN